jgi:methylmalonyl-CoA mutase
MDKLFSEFNPSTAADWKQQINKDLKGFDYEKLISHNNNGFDVNPFYTSEDLSEKQLSLFAHNNWEICTNINIGNDDKAANAEALKALIGGASSLIFTLYKKTDFNTLLKEISIEHIELNFVLKYPDPAFISDFTSYLKKQHIAAEKLNASVCFDVIHHFAESGNWYQSQEQDFLNQAKTSFKKISVNASLYQNAGATQSFELACALAHAHEYLVKLTEKKEPTESTFRFTVAIGSDFFGEIAKLRALRKLWAIISKEYAVNAELDLHAETSFINKSSLDAYTNMLRTSTEGMSAVIGGCNSLTINPYNESFENTTALSERMARNQQLIFKEESYLHHTADMGAGSYYIESLTNQLAEKAWEAFKQIEEKGGFMACLKSNYIQDTIQEQANQLITQFKEAQLVLVGVNKFQNPKETGTSEVKKHKREESATTLIRVIKPLSLAEHFVKQHA